MNTLYEYIEEQVLEYLNDVDVLDRFKYSIALSNKIYNLLTPKQKCSLETFMQTECNGRIVHNDFLDSEYICLFDRTKPINDPERVYQIWIPNHMINL